MGWITALSSFLAKPSYSFRRHFELKFQFLLSMSKFRGILNYLVQIPVVNRMKSSTKEFCNDVLKHSIVRCFESLVFFLPLSLSKSRGIFKSWTESPLLTRGVLFNVEVGLNIFYSQGKDWAWHKTQGCPLHEKVLFIYVCKQEALRKVHTSAIPDGLYLIFKLYINRYQNMQTTILMTRRVLKRQPITKFCKNPFVKF